MILLIVWPNKLATLANSLWLFWSISPEYTAVDSAQNGHESQRYGPR